MELHRLTPMQEGYDQALFNELYKKTHNLRESLIYQIDESRFGVTKDELRSWFDDKFIFVFNKYFGKLDNQVLLGYIINSLKTFKLKVLRRSYQANNAIALNTINLEDLSMFNITEDYRDDNQELLFNLAMEFLQKTLSREAWELLQIQLNPPLFILSKLKNRDSRIPGDLILQFLGEEVTPSNRNLIRDIRNEIKQAIDMARENFKELALS
jgi:hypothetical protein